MPTISEPLDSKNSESEFEKHSNSDDFEEDLENTSLQQTQTYFKNNLDNIVILAILSSLTVINFFAEAKLASLNCFFIVILITGYSLGKRFAILSAFLTILIVWAFILSDKSPYLVHHTHEMLIFYMTLWSGFLILTGWLGSAFAKSFARNTNSISHA